MLAVSLAGGTSLLEQIVSGENTPRPCKDLHFIRSGFDPESAFENTSLYV